MRLCRYQAEWQEQWETDTFPVVLAVFDQGIVGEGYRDRLAAIEPRITYLGKILSGVLQDNLEEWLNFNPRQRERLL